jgi:RNA polymerase sigma-70 factor, ECF subfamily
MVRIGGGALALLTAREVPDTHYLVMPLEGIRSEDAATLVTRIAKGDREAFSRFYDGLAGAAFGLIRRVVRDPGVAEEVLQDVFWEVWRDAPQYDPSRGSPEAWLLMRAKSRAIDKLRSIRRRGQTFVATVDESVARAPDTGPDRPGAALEERGQVERGLTQLPAAQRQVIELAFFGGLTQSEIATRLGEPLGTVKTRARLGLERLRGLLGGEQRPKT